MQKIILINDKQNLIALEQTQKQINEIRKKIKSADFDEQDLFISELSKLQKDYFRIKAEEGYFVLFDDFLKYSKLSLNILFDYLYKSENSIRINNKGTKMLINFSYELITENKNKNNEQIITKTDNKNIPDKLKDIPTNILLLDKNDLVKKENKIRIDDDDDDFGGGIAWIGHNKKDNYFEANQTYYLLIEYLLKTIEDDIDPIWSWQ